MYIFLVSSVANNFPDNSACNPKNHRVIERKTGTACDKDLHLHEWLRFVDAKENCLKIPMFGNEDYCYKVSSAPIVGYHVNAVSSD